LGFVFEITGSGLCLLEAEYFTRRMLFKTPPSKEKKENTMKKSFMTPGDGFKVAVEMVPPAGFDPEPLLEKLVNVSGLEFDGFSVAIRGLE